MRYHQLFEDYEDYDSALKKYVKDQNYKFGVIKHIDQLRDTYPVTENTTVYRGLNFKTKEKYEDFMSELLSNNNYYVVDTISSWSPSKEVAEQFAESEQTYDMPSQELLQAYTKSQKEGEKLVGYRGIILTTVVDPGYGIDVRKTSYGSESEILLLKGSYKVKVEIVKSYKDQIDDGMDPNDVIMSTTKEDVSNNSSFFSWVLKNINANQLNDKSKHKIYELVSYSINYGSDVFDNRFDTRSTIRIYYNTKLYELSRDGYLLSEDIHDLKDQGIDALKHFMEVAIKNPNHKIDTHSDIQYLVKFCNFENEWSEFLSMYGEEYRTRSNTVRDINKITDKKEKAKAIDDYKNDIMAILNNIVKM